MYVYIIKNTYIYIYMYMYIVYIVWYVCVSSGKFMKIWLAQNPKIYMKTYDKSCEIWWNMWMYKV